MRIELLRTEDRFAAEELWSLQHAAYRVEAALIGVADLPPLRDTIETIGVSRGIVWGARDEDGELAGAIEIEEGARELTIAKLMVHPAFFRRGIGSALLNHALAAYPVGKAWLVTAEVRNKPAIALYEKAGFRADYTFQPREDITMQLMRREERPGLPSRSPPRR
ncbi:GNAT family N-acetyltransferase [Cohnella fermenti]|uniref:GNAT family N-acetyltransferase n=1 Tax=Cohnella fermenti TaxID=2565925 RepID=A0A4S4BFR5_9BACL|nr:GNAT family N-acetyltransferase [Cohnella fermenti]THF72979.1 GNAT family N-acetyltransferase [Cohnella fermenti]